MATRDELDTLMRDTRLSADARVLGYFIACRSERGPAELEAEELEDALSADASAYRRRQALKQLERRGYLERTPGGRGHPVRYSFRVSGDDNLKPKEAEDRVSKSDTLKDRVSRIDNLKADRVSRTDNLSLARDAVSSLHDGDPPIVPRAAEAIEQHAELLDGCRGALRDYLEAHVPPKKQSGYVQTLATWLNGFGFSWKDASGSSVSPEDRTGLIAAALNELAAQGEEDMKYESGDPRNLRTKLSILSKPIERPTPAISSRDEQRHYRGHRTQAAQRQESRPSAIGGSAKAPDVAGGDAAQLWAKENPEAFQRIKDEIVRTEGIDMDDQLQRLRLTGLAIQRVREEQLTA